MEITGGAPLPICDVANGRGGAWTIVGVTGQMNVAASADGLLLYSAFNTLGQFMWIDRTAPAKKPLGVIGEPGEYGVFRLSPDGRHVAAMRDRPGGTDIWLLEVERGVSNPFTFNSKQGFQRVAAPIRSGARAGASCSTCRRTLS